MPLIIPDKKTERQRIVNILLSGKADATHLSVRIGLSEKDILVHLEHVRKSNPNLKIEPSKCLCCGFVFEDRTKLSVPSRCPKCKSERICKPVFYIEGSKNDTTKNTKRRVRKSSQR